MEVIELPKKLFVNVEDKGSKVNDKYGKIMDYNTCYWNCLESFMKKAGQYEFLNILELKKITTTDLPFNYIFTRSIDDPSQIGSCADHRVMQKTCNIFKINIYVLTSGTHIYKFRSNRDSESLCLFLHNNHFKIVNDETSKLLMIEVSKNPNLVLDIIPQSNGRHRKRGKDSSKSYKNKLLEVKCNKIDIFNDKIKVTKDIEKKVRKRGKR